MLLLNATIQNRLEIFLYFHRNIMSNQDSHNEIMARQESCVTIIAIAIRFSRLLVMLLRATIKNRFDLYLFSR